MLVSAYDALLVVLTCVLFVLAQADISEKIRISTDINFMIAILLIDAMKSRIP